MSAAVAVDQPVVEEKIAVPDELATRAELPQENIIYTLPPPPAFNLDIQDLTIGIPRAEHYLPLPVAIPVPKWFTKEKETPFKKSYIIQNVSASCGSGEVLAV